jgi:hypothetical protein
VAVDTQCRSGTFDMPVGTQVFLERGGQAGRNGVLIAAVLVEQIQLMRQQLEFADAAVCRGQR